MRTADECRTIAIRMDALAAGDGSGLGGEWRAMAVSWRDLARQAEWQDRYAVLHAPD